MKTALALSVALVFSSCRECEPWLGTWQGTFRGTIDGRDFRLEPSEFTVNFTTSGNGFIGTLDETLWTLGGGYTVSVFAAQLDCKKPELELRSQGNDGNTFCDVGLGSTSDTCEFQGTLFREGVSSGTFSAPRSTDQSPTFTGSGTWTLNPPTR